MALTKEQVEHAIKKTAGNISACARELGVARNTVYNKIEQHAELAQLLADTREELVDIAESALRREVINGNITAIIFTLKTQGRTRGYIEKQELEQSGAIEISVTYDRPDTR